MNYNIQKYVRSIKIYYGRIIIKKIKNKSNVLCVAWEGKSCFDCHSGLFGDDCVASGTYG